MIKKFDVQITEHAQKDLEQIFYYIAEDNPQNASRFILEIEKKVYSLEKFPARNPFIFENQYFGTNYRHLIHKKYRIIYRVFDNSVFIIRIIHGAKLAKL